MNLDLMQGNGLEHLPAFITSLGIGLLIGLERERSPAAKAGLRTFALVALLGTISGLLSDETGSPWILVGGVLVVGIMTVAAYQRDSKPESDPGTTTVAAIVMCYCLGALVWYAYSTLAVMLAITTTILLYYKSELRGITQSLTRRDLISMLQFSVLTFIILPILPDRSYGPYSALNPHQIWLMVVLISGISLSAYIALRIVGARYGAPLVGLLGGLVSSTATSLAYARHNREAPGIIQLAVVVILIANLMVLVRLAVVCSIVSPAILPELLPILGSGMIFGLASAAYWYRKLLEKSATVVPQIGNPAEIRAALGFGLLYALVLFCSAWFSDIAGSRGVYAVALISGLTDVDAITLSSLRLLALGNLHTQEATTAISLALLSNIIFKLGLVFSIGGADLGKRCAGGMLAVAFGVTLALLILRA
jgi:uncharacterized membrane protein (DUF4010 family)